MGLHPKIKTLDELVFLAEKLKTERKKIVLSHGDFDLIRYGHLHYLEESKKLGDVLIVSVVADEFVRKGPEKPIFDENTRARLIALLECVDYIVICQYFGPWGIIEKLKPDVYTKDERASVQLNNPHSGVSRDKATIESVGGTFVFTKTISSSSTDVLDGYDLALPDDALSFLAQLKKKYQVADIFIELEKLKKQKVLVVGETIIDEYRFVKPLGKPTKSHNVTTQFLNKEEFAGGAGALANHVASICSFVDLVTCLGKDDSRALFVAEHLKPNVRPIFFYYPDRPTIIKRRFIDKDTSFKLFEEYIYERKLLPSAIEEVVGKRLEEILEDYDLIIVIDYGHGFLSPNLIETIVSRAKFLAVNAQTNSGNAGFNYITKYPRADYICLDEMEARLATQNDTGDIKEVLLELYKKMNAKKMIITLGRQGSLAYEEGVGFISTPSLTSSVIDPVGAGDAFLAISAPCAAANFPLELVSFVGNVAGSIAVKILGNKAAVEKEILFRRIGSFLPD